MKKCHISKILTYMIPPIRLKTRRLSISVKKFKHNQWKIRVNVKIFQYQYDFSKACLVPVHV